MGRHGRRGGRAASDRVAARRRGARQGLARGGTRGRRGELGHLMARVLVAALVAMIIAILGGPTFINFLRRNEVGQHIREEGPQHHQEKQGTPTMGGLLIVLAATLAFLPLSDYTLPASPIFGTMLACAGIAFPAEVFMGDTGAMALGGAMAAMTIMMKVELLLLFVGGIFAIVALSVMLQVLSFKYWGRRIFLMAPLQHHFEMKAWSETKIMVRFWIVTAILCAAGFALFYKYFLQFRGQ